MGTHRQDVVGDNFVNIFVGEGEYIIPTSSVFGLSVEEAKQLQAEGLKDADHDRRNEGFEVHGASPFKVRTKIQSLNYLNELIFLCIGDAGAEYQRLGDRLRDNRDDCSRRQDIHHVDNEKTV